MKTIKVLLLCLPLVLASLGAFAFFNGAPMATGCMSPGELSSDLEHGGGLNACGCHVNRKTGECHCHQDRGCGCSCQPDRCK